MAINVNVTSSTIEGALHFSDKWVNIPTFGSDTTSESEFCACIMQCVPALPVFTDQVGTDFYKNDRFRITINPVPGTITTLKIVKQDGTEVTVTNNTYGEKTEISGFYSYYFDFYKIWNNLGHGTYYFTLTNSTIGGLTLKQDVSPKFRLMKYTDKAAYGTVRIETTQSGKLFNSLEYKGLFAGAKYEQQIRFRGSLVFSGQVVESSGYQLNTPDRSRLQVKDQVLPEYTLSVYNASAPQIARAMYDYLMANSVRVTDYNFLNHTIDPRNWSAERLLSIPLQPVDTTFSPSHNAIKRSYSFKMEYDNKNIFKINP
ncbi:MAG: hypothetical protein VKM97_07200 [Cyanobacteriota bacterium]|nr:hypothetical protein [Cyanobacteriota bacterium]